MKGIETTVVFAQVVSNDDMKLKLNARIISVIIIILTVVPFVIYLIPSISFGVNDEETQAVLQDTSVCLTVYMRESGKSIEVPLEEYVACVLACELPSDFEMEAMKAQAVAARTYGLAKSGTLCNSTHCQAFKTEDQIRKTRGETWMNTYWEKIKDAVTATRGEVVYYDGQLATQLMFHSSSGGRTENSEDVFSEKVPYLRSVSSPYEQDASHRNEKTSVTVTEFIDSINSLGEGTIDEDDVNDMKIVKKTDGGTVTQFKVGSLTFSGKEIQTLFNLSSAKFTVKVSGSKVVFTTNGFGHGVGMSQYGANGMAEKGYNYKQILKHYYTGIQIGHIDE